MERNPSYDASGSPAPSKAPPSLGGKSPTTAFDPRDLVPEPIFCCDAEGRFVWVNSAAEKLTGYGSAQLLAQSFSLLLAPTHQRRLSLFFIRRHLREVVETERDVPLLTRDGNIVWVGLRVRRVRTLHGRVGYVACAHDLHDMVFQIERLRDEVTGLQARVNEATSAARFKSDVLTAMSAEIRTPMDGVLSMTRLLLESSLDRDQRTFAEVILASGQALLQLVTDILDFSSIEAGKLELANLDFDVRVTVDSTASVLAPAAGARGVRLVRTVHSDVPSHIKGDPGRLRQVLAQLGERLIQHMEGGEASMWVTLVDESAHRVTLRFSLGLGGHANPEALTDLFAVFGQADLSRCRQLGADALSIALSRQLVRLMGGEAGVDVQQGGGTLWFQIPFQRREESAPVGPLPEVELNGLRVLVADPSIGMRMTLGDMLASWGCVTEAAEDGDAALERLREGARQGQPYRVALIDMQLPGFDGETMARAIRDNRELDGTLLMLLTNLGRRGDAARAQEWGYSAYLVKPFEPTYLYDALAEVLYRGTPASSEADIVTRHSVAERRRERLRILVVDDNPVNQLVAIAALRRAGYRPETATTASEAIQSHALHRFDLIFMDLELPDLDGIEATAEIYRMEEDTGRRTPIVAITGHDHPEVRRRCFEVGMKEILNKPIDLDAMCSGVDRWIQPGARGADEPALPIEGDAPLTVPPLTVVSQESDHSQPPAGEDELAVAAPEAPEAPAPVSAEAPVSEPAPAPMAAPSVVLEQPPSGALVLDEARLEASSMGNPELRNILVRTFVMHIRPRLARLREVAESGNLEAVEFEAHGLKGMCSTIGAMRCADVFGRIEKFGRERRPEPVAPLLDYAEIEVGQVEAFMGSQSKAA